MASEDLITGLIIAGCAAIAWLEQDRIAKTMEWHSSPLDWCEKNYVHTPWIVEFWNTLSSCLLAVIGLVGYLAYHDNKNIRKYEPQFVLIWIIMILVGVGSVWFHGTLSVAGQVSDEVPIVVLATVAVMMARPKVSWHGRSREIALSGHTLLRVTTVFIFFCLFFPVASHLFTLVCFPGCAYFFFTDYAKSKNPQFKRLFWTAIASFSIGFTSWILDRVACEPITQLGEKYLFGYPQLHAVWHVFIAMTFWLLIALGIGMRAEQDKITFSIENPNVLPVIHVFV